MNGTKAVFENGAEYLIQKDSIELKKFPDVGRHWFGSPNNLEIFADTEISFSLSPKEDKGIVKFQGEDTHTLQLIGVDGINKIKPVSTFIDGDKITIYGIYV